MQGNGLNIWHLASYHFSINAHAGFGDCIILALEAGISAKLLKLGVK
jgi:hypothetical protein